MSDHLQQELKKEFQLERMILFSDAVFAIAITLLAIELKVPEFDKHTATDQLLYEKLAEMIPKFMGFLVSFFVIGMYWTFHHKLFGYVTGYTRNTLSLNLAFLLAVVLMPFSTSFYTQYLLQPVKAPVIIYVLNISFIGITNLLLWMHVNNPRNAISPGIPSNERKYYIFRSISIPIIFIIIALIYFFVNSKVAVWIPLLIPLITRRIRKVMLKKTPERTTPTHS